ncbi:MAG: sporulation protein [Oscillospiraceae bacterium]|nr:sporulation protein [Oscillospiraceae bacterium]
MIQQETALDSATHGIVLDGRRTLSVTGVTDVERFDEQSVVLVTTAGVLMICGEELHISRLSLETGELGVEGRIDRLIYAEEHSAAGFWSRLFR